MQLQGHKNPPLGGNSTTVSTQHPAVDYFPVTAFAVSIGCALLELSNDHMAPVLIQVKVLKCSTFAEHS